MFSDSKVKIETPDESFEAEKADTFLSKFMGFRFHSEGKMLFSFHREKNPAIDMMLVSESLYLYFIDSDKKIINTQKATSYSFDPRTWKLYRSEKPYRYLLESFEELDLKKGDQLEFEV